MRAAVAGAGRAGRRGGMPLVLGVAAAKAAGETAGRLRDGHGLSAEQADALLEIARVDVCKDALAEVDGLSAGLRDCALLVVHDSGASRRPAVTALNVLGELGRVVYLEACGGDARRNATAELRPLAALPLARHGIGGRQVGVEEGEGGRGVDVGEAHGGQLVGPRPRAG